MLNTNDGGEKIFDEWNEVKKELDGSGTCRTIKEAEVWWYGAGRNVGTEINGKGGHFARPVVIVKKLSRYNFIGVPLTSQPHEGSWYAHFVFQGRDQYAVVAQVRNYSVARLYRRIGMLPELDYDVVCLALLNLLRAR